MTKRKSLAEFKSYGPAAQLVALSCCFAPYWERIAPPLRGFYPDTHLQERLGFLLWQYARQHAGLDYSGSESSAQERLDLKTLNKALRAAYPVFWRVVYRGIGPGPKPGLVDEGTVPTTLHGMDNLELMLFASGLTGQVLYDLLGCFITFLDLSRQREIKLGRPKKHLALEKLMMEIGKLYERATGEFAVNAVQFQGAKRGAKATFTGNFFELARLVETAAVAATHRKRSSDIALGRLLQRALPPKGLLQRGPSPQWVRRRTTTEEQRDAARKAVRNDPRYVLAHKHLYKKG
jgi:hypothetical protein